MQKWEARAKFYPGEGSWLYWQSYWLIKGLQTSSQLSVFWVESFTFLPCWVVSWDAQLLRIPRNVSSFLWPQRLGVHLCLPASISSSPELFLSDGNSMFAGGLLPFPACCGPLAASHTSVSSVAPSSLPFFSEQRMYSAPRVYNQESQQSFIYAAPSFSDYMWYNHRHWKSQFYLSFTSHPTYPNRAIKETITRTWFQHWQCFLRLSWALHPKWKLTYRHSCGKPGQHSDVRNM